MTASLLHALFYTLSLTRVFGLKQELLFAWQTQYIVF